MQQLLRSTYESRLLLGETFMRCNMIDAPFFPHKRLFADASSPDILIGTEVESY